MCPCVNVPGAPILKGCKSGAYDCLSQAIECAESLHEFSIKYVINAV